VNIQYIRLKNSKKTFSLIIILILLIIAYLALEFFDVRETVANKVEFANSISELKFVLGGETCGIKLLATGVLVVDIDDSNADLKPGDVILKLDDTRIDSNKELVEYINKEDVIKKGKVTLTVERDGKELTKAAKLIKNEETNTYELGLWVKDSSAGVGMVTFYETTTKSFAALGHGITETRNNVILPIQSGAIVKSKITSINKAEPKEPGDLRATIYKDIYGQIRKNTANGIYGTLEDETLIETKKEIIEAASKEEVKVGKAYIYCTLDEKIEKFEIEITNVLYDALGNKNMIINVTDEKLLEKTGGIVQGMSGSPIVQNGKLVGAVTHVFLNNPKRGYAVFIENMIEDMMEMW